MRNPIFQDLPQSTHGISVSVLNMASLVPIDKDAVIQADKARGHKARDQKRGVKKRGVCC